MTDEKVEHGADGDGVPVAPADVETGERPAGEAQETEKSSDPEPVEPTD